MFIAGETDGYCKGSKKFSVKSCSDLCSSGPNRLDTVAISVNLLLDV